jgi:putative glutathione S-transferase
MSWETSVSKGGAFERKASVFREWISSAPGSAHPPAANRYHLYVCLACPWAHRTLIMKRLKGLDDCIGHTAVDWLLNKDVGWEFSDTKDGCGKDPIHGFQRLRQVYELSNPSYEGNVTVPVLFDRQADRIVNNESADILRMLNAEFNAFSASPEQAALDLYPVALRPSIDGLNEWIYPLINDGVYKCGFSRTQEAYDKAVTALFDALDRLDGLLSTRRYLTGPSLTEADVRLFTTLIRFDAVYVGHFKCAKRCIREYKHLHPYMLELYQMPHIRPTVNMFHIQHHYYASHAHINPTRIVPQGPIVDLDQPHGRDTQRYTA